MAGQRMTRMRTGQALVAVLSGVAMLSCSRGDSPGANQGIGQVTESIAELDGLKAGQVWAYQTRAQEPESRVIIGRLERISGGGAVAHLQVNGLRIRSPTSTGGFQDLLPRAPFSTDALRGSVTKLLGEVPVSSLAGFET